MTLNLNIPTLILIVFTIVYAIKLAYFYGRYSACESLRVTVPFDNARAHEFIRTSQSFASDDMERTWRGWLVATAVALAVFLACWRLFN